MAPLSETLKTLGLHPTATHLDDLVALATKRRWSPIQLLEHLVATEQQERTRRRLERRLARAPIGRFTPMSDSTGRGRRASIAPRSRPSCVSLRLDFLAAGRNLVCVASQGLGKTMIAQNIAQQAIRGSDLILLEARSDLLRLIAHSPSSPSVRDGR